MQEKLKAFENLDQRKTYILGVSGGPDSIFLLEKMRCWGFNFLVAHVNYGQRKESNQDEYLVRKYCQKWNLPFLVHYADFQCQKTQKNFQAWAREERYNFFARLGENIVLAHHLDDHLETYWWQKNRQSLVENWGLTFKVRWEKATKTIYLFRPLLSLSKEEIFQHLVAKKLTFARDSTNYSLVYQRNVLRKKLAQLSQAEKKALVQEIRQKNQELKEIKLVLKQQIQQAIVNSTLNLLVWQKNLSSQLKLRLLYFWVNQQTNQAFVRRKKQIWAEISKQLVSKKNPLTILLSKNYQIKKKFPWAYLEKRSIK